MSVAFASIPQIVIDDLTPGASKVFTFTVDVAQPPTNTTGSVTVSSSGDTTSAPVSIQFNVGPNVPTLDIDLGAASSHLTASVGTPAQRAATPSTWDVPVTVTAV